MMLLLFSFEDNTAFTYMVVQSVCFNIIVRNGRVCIFEFRNIYHLEIEDNKIFIRFRFNSIN